MQLKVTGLFNIVLGRRKPCRQQQHALITFLDGLKIETIRTKLLLQENRYLFTQNELVTLLDESLSFIEALTSIIKCWSVAKVEALRTVLEKPRLPTESERNTGIDRSESDSEVASLSDSLSSIASDSCIQYSMEEESENYPDCSEFVCTKRKLPHLDEKSIIETGFSFHKNSGAVESFPE